MSAINGVQLARLWAKAWKEPVFENLLETDPLAAAQQFKRDCDADPAKYEPFPDPLQLLDLEEYEHATVIFKKMPKALLNEIIKKNKEVPWTKNQWLSSGEVLRELLRSELELY